MRDAVFEMTLPSSDPALQRPTYIPPEVLPGKDGWLFFVGHRGTMAGMYSFRPRYLWLLFRWHALIKARIRRARRLGARYVQFIVPDKLSIYRDRLEAPFPSSEMSPARRLGLTLPGENWVKSYEGFLAARPEGDLYYRTDTHWSAKGYLLGYTLLCEALGVTPPPHVMSATLQRRPHLMDIASKCEPPIEEMEEVHVFERHARRIAANAIVEYREASPVHIVGTSFGSRIVLRNDGPDVDPRTVVVFGDSHLFHPCGLGAMLGETFREVHLLWSSPIDWNYVEGVRPALLVHELSERYLRRTPVDGIDIDAFADARLDEARVAQSS